MTQTNDSILGIFNRRLESLLDELHHDEIFADVLLRQGSWANQNGIITAYLSIFPHKDPSEDSVDAVISLQVAKNSAHFEADICKPDGEILSQISRNDLPFETISELVVQIDKLSESIMAQMRTSLIAAMLSK